MPTQENPYADYLQYAGGETPSGSTDYLNSPENPYAEYLPYYGGEVQQAVSPDEDPTWGDYGRLLMSGGAQIGSGIGWLAKKFGVPGGESLQQAGAEAAEWWMQDLSPQAKAAFQVEFTKRDRGELWTDAKWNKAKMMAAQSMLGTMSGMGLGAFFTKGLAAAGMTRTAATAAGGTVTIPSRTAGAIGYGAGEAAIAAPSVGAEVENEIMGMTHDELYEKALDYRAIYDGLENLDPAAREERAKRLLADAATGDPTALAFVSTFLLSAPFGSLMARMTAGVPLSTGGGRIAGGIRGAGGEAGQEFLQSGAEALATNVGIPGRPLGENVLESAVGGALSGGIMGAGPGLAASPERALADTTGTLPDEESPLSALGRSAQDTQTPVDELTETLDKILPEAQAAAAQGDELDAALEDALISLGVSAQEAAEYDEQQKIEELLRAEAVRAEQAEAQELAAKEAETIAEEQRLIEEDAARAAPFIELEAARDAQIARQQEAAFAAQEKERARTERLRPREEEQGFREIESERREEAYQAELARGEAAGVGVGRFEGTPVGEELQRARQEQIRESKEGVAVEREQREVPPEPKVVSKPQSAKADLRKHSLLELLARDRRPRDAAGKPSTVAHARLDWDSWQSEGIDPADMRDPGIAYKRRSPFVKTRKGQARVGMTPDDLAERLNEEGWQNPYSPNEEWSANDALQAVQEEIGGAPLYHPTASETIGAREAYEKEYAEWEQQKEEIEQTNQAKTWRLEVRGLEATVTEYPAGNIDVEIGDEVVGLVDRDGKSNRKLVEDIITERGKQFRYATSKKTGKKKTKKKAQSREEWEKEWEKEQEKIKKKTDFELRNVMNDWHGLDPNRTDQEYWGEYTTETAGHIQRMRVSLTNEVRGNPVYTVAFQNRESEGGFVPIGEIQKKKADKEGNEWVQIIKGEEVGRWHDFAHAASMFPMEGADLKSSSLRFARSEQKRAGFGRSKSKATGSQTDMFGAVSEQQKAIENKRRKRTEKEQAAPEADMNVEGDIFTGTGAASAAAKYAAEMEAAQTDIEEAAREGEVIPAQQYPVVQIMEDEDGVTVSFGGFEQTYEGFTRVEAEARFREQYADVLGSPEGRAAAGGVPAEELDTGGETIEGIRFDVPEGTEFMDTAEAEQLADPNIPLPLLESQEGPYLDNLEAKIKREGWKKPIQIVKSDKPYIYDGNHRLAIAIRNNLPQVPIEYISEAKAKGLPITATAAEERQETVWPEEATHREKTERFAGIDPKELLIRTHELLSAYEYRRSQGSKTAPHEVRDIYERIQFLQGVEFEKKADQKRFEKVVETFEAQYGDDFDLRAGAYQLPETDKAYAHYDQVLEDMREGRRQVEVFPKPKKGEYINYESKGKKEPLISGEEALETVQSWKDEANRIGLEQDNSRRIILSLFDESGVWSEPWRVAGYVTIQLDKQLGFDILYDKLSPTAVIAEIEATFGGRIEGVLAAVPCTSFSGAGARFWDSQHDKPNREMVRKKYGDYAAEHYDTPLEYAKMLVSMTELYVELSAPRFHVLENPVGRMPRVTGLPEPKMLFMPNNFGNPYIKRTQLWGDFNNDMPMANTEPTEGSKAHRLRGDNPKQKKERSLTPEGFAYSFFMANHTDGPALNYEKIGQMQQETRAAGTETEAEREARLEREAIQGEQEFTEEQFDDLGELPGWDDIQEEAATSPESEWAEPTEGQKEAGNYKKAHVKMFGVMDITIENPAGTDRNGFTQTQHYGYMRLTKAADGDHLDMFINPNIQNDYSRKVWVIDQMDQDTNQFDEHKVMFGYRNQLDAVKAYKNSYEKGWNVGPVTEMTMPEFLNWALSGKKLTQPLSQDKFFGEQSRLSGRASERTTPEFPYGTRRFRYAKPENEELFLDAADLLTAPNLKWLGEAISIRQDQTPSPQETEAINRVVDRLIETTERRQNLERRLKDRGKPDRRQYSRQRLEKDIQGIRAAMPGAPITLLNNYKEAPALIVAAMESQDMTDVKAVTDPQTGKIYMFADRINNKDEGIRTAIHEGVHKGLRAAFGEELDPLLLDLWNNVPEHRRAEMDEIVERYRLDPNNQEDQIEAAEELITHMAENEPENSYVQSIIAKIRQMLRRAGVELGEWTDQEIVEAIKEARGAIARRTDRIAGVTFEEDVTLDETGEIFTIEQNAEEVLTQHDKRVENCERLKACIG